MAYASAEEMDRREKRFAELYVFETHGNQMASYRQMCQESGRNLKETTVRSKASDFFRRPGTQKYIKECRAEAQEIYNINKEEIIANLVEIATDETTTKRDRIAALKELNSMAGFNSSNVKLQADASIDVVIE